MDSSLAARRRGVRPGMPVAEARALLERGTPPASTPSVPSSRRAASSGKSASSAGVPFFAELDQAADRAALAELAHRCETYSPLYGVEEADAPECLLLDGTGSAPLFGGLQALAEKIQADFQLQGWRVRVAVAPTIGAAWGVAHGVSRDNQAVVVPPEGLAETLDPLPLRMLRLPDRLLATLSELGIHGIGQLRRLPRERLPARFGPQVLRRLDQAWGAARELIVVERRAEPIVATWAAQEPFRDRGLLLEVCHRLLEQLLQPLREQRRGLRRLHCQLHGCGGRPAEFTLGTLSPSHSVERWHKLLELQLERLPGDDELVFVRLAGEEAAPLEERPRDLLGDPLDPDSTRELQWLMERLSSRLGADSVTRAAYVPDPQPELSVRYQPWLDGDSPAPADEEATKDERLRSLARPLRLLAAPQPIKVPLVESSGVPRRFFWNQVEHAVCQAWGPERIETGWWRGRPVQRDYYRVEAASGERFWIFRAPDGWFLQGLG